MLRHSTANFEPLLALPVDIAAAKPPSVLALLKVHSSSTNAPVDMVGANQQRKPAGCLTTWEMIDVPIRVAQCLPHRVNVDALEGWIRRWKSWINRCWQPKVETCGKCDDGRSLEKLELSSMHLGTLQKISCWTPAYLYTCAHRFGNNGQFVGSLVLYRELLMVRHPEQGTVPTSEAVRTCLLNQRCSGHKQRTQYHFVSCCLHSATFDFHHRSRTLHRPSLQYFVSESTTPTAYRSLLNVEVQRCSTLYDWELEKFSSGADLLESSSSNVTMNRFVPHSSQAAVSRSGNSRSVPIGAPKSQSSVTQFTKFLVIANSHCTAS